MRGKISQEIMADVTAARESNAKEIEELHAGLNSISDLHKAIVNRQEELITQNTLLYPERDQVKAKHERDMAALNHQIGLKLSRRVQLQQTLNKVEELKNCIAATEHSKSALERNMAREREAFNGTKIGLLDEVKQVAQNTLKQKQENYVKKKKLSQSTSHLLDREDRLAELTHRSALLEQALERLAASRGRHEEQLREATHSHLDALRQMESAERELCELRQHYQAASQQLQEDLILLDHDLDEGKAAGVVRRRSLAVVTESAKAQQREENEARAIHLNISQRLGRTTLLLEERMSSIARHCIEAREMEEEMGQLLETNLLNGALFQEGQEKLQSRLEMEQRNLDEAEEGKGQLERLLQQTKREQEAHVAKAATDIHGVREKYRELCQEEVELRPRLALSDEVDGLTGQVTQAELDFVQMESEYRGQIEQLARDTEHVLRASDVKKKELEEREATLREAEARYDQEESTFQGLELLFAALKSEKSHLELSMEKLQEKTALLLRPREEMKARLEAECALHRGLLVSQASELRAVEVGIHNGGRKLEQVSMENSRMHLSVLRVKEDVANTRKDTERHRKSIVAFREEEEALLERVLRAWGEDLSLTREGRDGNRPLLEAFEALLGQLENRSVQFESVTKRVQQQLLHISKLGY
ncbi:unnamed protein product [Lota lota]